MLFRMFYRFIVSIPLFILLTLFVVVLCPVVLMDSAYLQLRKLHIMMSSETSSVIEKQIAVLEAKNKDEIPFRDFLSGYAGIASYIWNGYKEV